MSDLLDCLMDEIERLAVHLLGKPSSKKGNQWRWGSKGSIVVSMKGARRGSWYDHEASQGGGPLQLIMHRLSLEYDAATEWAQKYFGVPTSDFQSDGVNQ